MAVVWLLMLASHGRRLRQIRMSAQVCGIVPGRTISRILWWLGAMVIFVWGMGVWTMFLVSFNHYPTVNNGQVEKGVRIDNLIDHLRKWDWAFIDDDRVLAALAVWVSLLLLLPMAVWSLARPKVRWCAAVANMLLAVGIVAIAAGLVTSFHASAELPVPHGFGVVTAWWIVPIVAGWALVQTGRTMIGLFSSPLGGIPSHACCQAGVLTSFGRLIPWERFTSYDWLSETLVLRRAPLWGIPRLVRGTVPTAERAAADELLAARLPRDDMRVFGDRGEGIAVRDIAAGCALLFVGCAAIGLRGMVVLACCALIAGPAAIAWGAWTLRGIARRSGPQASAAVIPEVRGSLQRVAIASGVVCFCIAMLAFLLVRSGAGMIDSSACGLIFGAPVVIAWMWPLAVCGRWVREIRKHAQVCCIAASPKSGPMSWWLVVWLVFLVCVLWWNVLMFGHALGREPVWSWSVMMAVGTVILLAIWLWSRARPAVLWLSAAARVALACMVVQFVNLATFAVDSAFPTQQPYRMVLATVSCVIPAVGAWALFQLGRSVVGLYSSPLGGIPSHACCQDGVLMSFGRLIPWERFTSYDWLGETLVLRRAPLWGIPRLVRGTVPTAERAAADELLAARLPRYEPHRSETGNE